MATFGMQLVLPIFALSLIALYFQARQTSAGSRVWDLSTQERRTINEMPMLRNSSYVSVSVAAFCHTEQGLNVRKFQNTSVSSRNCYGYCKRKTPESVSFLDEAIEAPRVSSLCLLNPFHGFYDCVWPLVHYLTTCVALRQFVTPPVILLNNDVLSAERRHKWVVHAQEKFLQGAKGKSSLVEKNRIPGGQCICFRSMVKFNDTYFWRPTRFRYKQEFEKTTVFGSHPVGTKQNGLVAFRETVLRGYGKDSSPPHSMSPVLVYGREDATRRIWRNAATFIRLLAQQLPPGIPIHHMKEVPNSFEEQVTVFNEAALLVAPHGAAMANTLFMKERSAILEISSRYCFSERGVAERNITRLDMDTVQNASDPNAWVPWHAQSLGFYHLSAPCFHMGEDYNTFETENESLVQQAIVLLKLPRKINK